ncbi:hypothetical protein GCM10029964_111710 [Kibdelosporangium lantanae]
MRDDVHRRRSGSVFAQLGGHGGGGYDDGRRLLGGTADHRPVPGGAARGERLRVRERDRVVDRHDKRPFRRGWGERGGRVYDVTAWPQPYAPLPRGDQRPPGQRKHARVHGGAPVVRGDGGERPARRCGIRHGLEQLTRVPASAAGDWGQELLREHNQLGHGP